MPPAPIFHLLTIRFHLFGICWNNWTNTPGRLPLESKVGGRGILHGHLVALMMSHANYFSNSQITSIAVASFGRVLPWTSWTRLWRRYRLCRTDKPLTWSPTRLLPSVVPRNPCISVTTLTEKIRHFSKLFRLCWPQVRRVSSLAVEPLQFHAGESHWLRKKTEIRQIIFQEKKSRFSTPTPSVDGSCNYVLPTSGSHAIDLKRRKITHPECDPASRYRWFDWNGTTWLVQGCLAVRADRRLQF